MKLILAIVNKEDAVRVTDEITKAGYGVTKLATTGGFLQAGNTTFLVGADDSRVDEVLELIEVHSKHRTQMISGAAYGAASATSIPVEVTVGGATVFVLDVERFEKL